MAQKEKVGSSAILERGKRGDIQISYGAWGDFERHVRRAVTYEYYNRMITEGEKNQLGLTRKSNAAGFTYVHNSDKEKSDEQELLDFLEAVRGRRNSRTPPRGSMWDDKVTETKKKYEHARRSLGAAKADSIEKAKRAGWMTSSSGRTIHLQGQTWSSSRIIDSGS